MAKDYRNRARSIVASNIFMCLATSGKGNKPWASTVRYHVDKSYNFYFVSSKNSRHMQNIRFNPSVSFSIYDSRARESEIDGLQADATAKILEGKEIDRVLASIYKDLESDLNVRPTAKDFSGKALKRFVKLKVLAAYKLNTDSKRGEGTRIRVRL